MVYKYLNILKELKVHINKFNIVRLKIDSRNKKLHASY